MKFTSENGYVVLSAELKKDDVDYQMEKKLNILENECPENYYNQLRIKVQDSGAGISEKNQKSLFSEFKQINPAKLQNGGGSGLGLWG